MAGARSRRSCAIAAGPPHDASRIGAGIAFDGRINTRVSAESCLSGDRARAMLDHLDFDWGAGMRALQPVLTIILTIALLTAPLAAQTFSGSCQAISF